MHLHSSFFCPGHNFAEPAPGVGSVGEAGDKHNVSWFPSSRIKVMLGHNCMAITGMLGFLNFIGNPWKLNVLGMCEECGTLAVATGETVEALLAPDPEDFCH